MTFNENDVNRDRDGKFGQKTGSQSNISLARDASERLDDDGGYVLPDDITSADGEVFLSTLRQVGFARHEDIALRDEVMHDRAAGRTSIYDHHYTDIWNGNSTNIFGEQDGWSKEVVEQKLAHTVAVKHALQNGKIRASDISANFEKQNDGIAWCKSVESELNTALASEGRSLFKNAAAARDRYKDFEGGRNSR